MRKIQMSLMRKVTKSEAKKVLLFYLRKRPWWSIRGAKRFLSVCFKGDMGKQISRVCLSAAEVSRAGRIPQALLPSAENQNKILQAIRAANSVCTLDIGKILEPKITF